MIPKDSSYCFLHSSMILLNDQSQKESKHVREQDGLTTNGSPNHHPIAFESRPLHVPMSQNETRDLVYLSEDFNPPFY